MTQQTIEPGTRRTVSGTVQNPHEDGHGHYIFDLKGTGWTQPQFVVAAFEVMQRSNLDALHVGQQYTFDVEAQKPRNDKGDQFERNWYWRIVSLSNGAAPGPHPSPLPNDGEAAAATTAYGNDDPAYWERKRAALARDPQRDSIERQTSLKAAVELVASGYLPVQVHQANEALGIIGSDDCLEVVLCAAESFLAWVQQKPVAPPSATAEAAEASETPGSAAAGPDEPPGDDLAF